MADVISEVTVSQICKMIDLLNPCMDDYVYVYDLVEDFYYISPSATERFCLPASTFHDVVANHAKFVYEPDLTALQDDLAELIEGKKDSHNLHYRWLSINREPIWINCRGQVIRQDGKPLYMIGCINETGKRQQADNVSGLLGISHLKALISSDNFTVPDGYMLRLGLDDFKEINEKLGIEYGDMLLKRTAECISGCLLPQQQLYRAGSDEFLIADFSGRTVDEATIQYKQIRQSIDQFVEDNNYEAVFTISGGILPNSSCKNYGFNGIMKFSEFSLNEAKREGKNHSCIFDQKKYEKFLRRRRLTQLIRKSITNNFEGFEAYLQPLFCAEDNSLYGAEALMRFKTEEFGMVSPGEFIPVLEESGLIIPVGKWMLNESLELCNRIHQIDPYFRISINISYIQVLKSNIIAEILTAVTEHSIVPSTVIIELTESGLVAPDARITKLWSRMKDQGIKLALDDFGTGYSNFHYLNELKPDIIKIDRTFTVKAVQNEYEYNLLSLISNMVHSMNLKICVEGIETTDELGKMKELLPDYCQGYLFGKPCPYDEFVEKYLCH